MIIASHHREWVLPTMRGRNSCEVQHHYLYADSCAFGSLRDLFTLIFEVRLAHMDKRIQRQLMFEETHVPAVITHHKLSE